MGKAKVVFPDILIVGLDVLFKLWTVLGKIIAGLGESHHAHVEEVGASPQHTAGRPRPLGYHVSPAFQVFDGAGR